MIDINSDDENSKKNIDENEYNEILIELMEPEDFKDQAEKYFKFIDKNIENFKNFGKRLTTLLFNSKFFDENSYQEYIKCPREFFLNFFPSDISNWGILHITNLRTLDFSFLDGYSPKIKSLMINICLKFENVSGFDEDMSELFDQITTINDVIDIITIISENNLYISDNKKFIKQEITDLKLNQIILETTIQKSKNNNILKMEKLFNSVFLREVSGDISATFKFLDQNNNLNLHSFILVEEYFINCIEKFNKTKNICIEIDQNFSEILYFEIIKYLYTGTISEKLPQQILIDLYFFGEKYFLKLKDITLRILQLGDELRITIGRPFKLIPNEITPLNYPSYFVKFISDFLILVKIDGQLYYIKKIFGSIIEKITNINTFDILDGKSTKNFLQKNNVLYLKNTNYKVEIL